MRIVHTTSSSRFLIMGFLGVFGFAQWSSRVDACVWQEVGGHGVPMPSQVLKGWLEFEQKLAAKEMQVLVEIKSGGNSVSTSRLNYVTGRNGVLLESTSIHAKPVQPNSLASLTGVAVYNRDYSFTGNLANSTNQLDIGSISQPGSSDWADMSIRKTHLAQHAAIHFIHHLSWPKLVREPAFRVLDIRHFELDGFPSVEIAFEVTPEEEIWKPHRKHGIESSIMKVSNGRALFSEKYSWLPYSVELVGRWFGDSEDFSVVVNTTFSETEYGLLPKRVEMRSTGMSSGQHASESREFSYSNIGNEPPKERFTLTHYGLMEPATPNNRGFAVKQWSVLVVSFAGIVWIVFRFRNWSR